LKKVMEDDNYYIDLAGYDIWIIDKIKNPAKPLAKL
jgi:hypothetical protein